MSDRPCDFDGCDQPAQARNIHCSGHLKQKQRGQPLTTLKARRATKLEHLIDSALAYAEADAEDDAEFAKAFENLKRAGYAFGGEAKVAVASFLSQEMARRGKSGGLARAAKLTAEERTAVAKNAAVARWRKRTA